MILIRSCVMMVITIAKEKIHEIHLQIELLVKSKVGGPHVDRPK